MFSEQLTRNTLRQCMAVASGRAGRVLARPLFRRLNARTCMGTLNTRLGKRLPIIAQISPTKRQRCVRIFSHFGLLGGHAFLYCDEPVLLAARSRAQLSSYAESEISSLVPVQFPSFCSIRTASDRKLGGSLATRLLIQHSM